MQFQIKKNRKRLQKGWIVTLISLWILMMSAFPGLAAYNNTNLNTFIHNDGYIPEGEAGMPFHLRFQVGYNGVQGLYNPAYDYVNNVDVRLSNDQTYLGVTVEVGSSKSAVIRKIEKILGDDIDEEKLGQYYEGYIDGYNDTSKGSVFYNYPVDSGSYPFEVDGQLFTQNYHIDQLNKGEYQEVSFDITVRRDTGSGYYAIPIVFYYDAPGQVGGASSIRQSHVEYINIYIREKSDTGTGKAAQEVQFIMGEGQLTPAGSYPSVMNYTVNMRNSKMQAFDVTVSLDKKISEGSEVQLTSNTKSSSQKGFPFLINEVNYDRHYDEIAAGETVSLPYSMAISSRAASGFYPLSYTVTFRKSKGGTLYTENHSAYVRISNPSMDKSDDEESDKEWNANTSTKARLILSGYTTIPEEIYSGDEFELRMKLKNASEGINASNILLNLSSEETSEKSAVFIPEGGISSMVIASLKPGEENEIVMHYTSKAGIDQGNYKITIKEKYDSPDFKNAEEELSLSIPVHQMQKLSFSSFEVTPDTIQVGEDANVMFGINNTGKVTLYNVTVSFENEAIKDSNSYLGNIKPGETGNLDVMLTGVQGNEEEPEITAVVSYEDENGKVSQMEKTFQLNIMDISSENMEIMIPEEDSEPKKTGIWSQKPVIYGGGAAAFVIAAVWFWYLKKKKKTGK